MTVEAEVLLVARAAGLAVRSGNGRMASQEVALVRELGDRSERISLQVDVARRAARVRILIGVVVALQARRVAGADRNRVAGLR